MKKSFNTFLMLLAVVTIFSAVPGCKSKPKDADIRTSVEKALNSDPETSSLMVDVRDGVATISGEARDAAAKASASVIAGKVKGVKSVQNNVTIAQAPVAITADDPLSAGVRDATKDFPGVNATVNDGVISVSGELTAANWKRLKMTLDGLKPKKVDASGLKISK
ncbi:MAG TPA: BON domain-containing protein [Chitinophagaceae bacterium]|nr:BON domain-containing protein [Chitinophagaceae bacterium]